MASSTSGPPGYEPIRLDFFGDELKRLTVFDIANQRSVRDVDEAVISPSREWVPGEASRLRGEELIVSQPWGREMFDRLATGRLFDGMEGWMSLFVERPERCSTSCAVTVLVVEPDRVGQRLADLLDEERELTNAVATTWKASSPVPLLHTNWHDVLEGRADINLEPTVGSLGSSGLNLGSPPVVQGDPSRIAAHVRSWSTVRRGVVLTSNAAAVERMAEQLRSEGLEVTTDPAKVLEVRLSVLESSLPAGFSWTIPKSWSGARAT